jgi:hypothetical protein
MTQNFQSDDAIIGVRANGLSCYPEANATVGDLLADRRLDWHLAVHEGGGHVVVGWLVNMGVSCATIRSS